MAELMGGACKNHRETTRLNSGMVFTQSSTVLPAWEHLALSHADNKQNLRKILAGDLGKFILLFFVIAIVSHRTIKEI